LKRIKLPENIFEAVRECQKITAHGARRRQVAYLGKLMRGVDDEPIRAGLAMLRGESSAETARLHRLERFRVRLLEDEAVLAEIAALWPAVDLQHLRTLRRNALKEQENNKPPKNFRAIFQVLQELDKQGTPASEEESNDE
jgi:ribosome-associated protein